MNYNSANYYFFISSDYHYRGGFFFAVKEVSLLDQGNQGKQSVYQLEQVRQPDRVALKCFIIFFHTLLLIAF